MPMRATQALHRSTRALAGTLLPAILTILAVLPASPDAKDPASSVELVKAAVFNEVAASAGSAKYMFRSRKQTAQGSQTRLYVETLQAMAGMTIAYNDEPLTPDQKSGEESRLAGLLGSPDQMSRKQAQERKIRIGTLRIVKALPDAFLYEYDGEENGPGEPGQGGRAFASAEVPPQSCVPAAVARRTGSGRHAGISFHRSQSEKNRENRRHSV